MTYLLCVAFPHLHPKKTKVDDNIVLFWGFCTVQNRRSCSMLESLARNRQTSDGQHAVYIFEAEVSLKRRYLH